MTPKASCMRFRSASAGAIGSECVRNVSAMRCHASPRRSAKASPKVASWDVSLPGASRTTNAAARFAELLVGTAQTSSGSEASSVALGHREVVRAHVLHAEPEELRRRLGRDRGLGEPPRLLVRGELLGALHLGAALLRLLGEARRLDGAALGLDAPPLLLFVLLRFFPGRVRGPPLVSAHHLRGRRNITAGERRPGAGDEHGERQYGDEDLEDAAAARRRRRRLVVERARVAVLPARGGGAPARRPRRGVLPRRR